MKDADMYHGTIYEYQESKSTAFGYTAPSEMGSDISFDPEEIREAIRNKSLNFVTMNNGYGCVSIDVCGNRDFSYLDVAEQPRTIIRIDGFDTDIAQELTALVSQTGSTKVAEQDLSYLTNSIAEILKQFKFIKSIPSQHQ